VSVPAVRSFGADKMMALYAQTEIDGGRLYAAVGTLSTGQWEAPVALPVGEAQPYRRTSLGRWEDSHPLGLGRLGASGAMVATWASPVPGGSLGSGSQLHYALRASSGEWSQAVRWVEAGADNVVWQAQAGSGHVAFGVVRPASGQTSGQWELVLQRFSPTGATSAEVLPLGSMFSGHAVRMALSDAGRLSVAWADATGRMRLATQGSPSWSTPLTLGPVGDNFQYNAQAQTHLSVAPTGEIGLAWQGYGSVISTVMLDANAQVLRSESLKVDALNTTPNLVSLGQGRFMLGFIVGARTSWTVPYISTFNPSTGWSSPARVSDFTTGDWLNLQRNPDGSVSMFARGAHLAYSLISPSATSATSMFNAVWSEPTTVVAHEAATGRTFVLSPSSNVMRSYVLR
jgi:hypothetical protein